MAQSNQPRQVTITIPPRQNILLVVAAIILLAVVFAIGRLTAPTTPSAAAAGVETPSPTTDLTDQTREATAEATSGIFPVECFDTSPYYNEVEVGKYSQGKKVSDDGHVQRLSELQRNWTDGWSSWVKASGGKWFGKLCRQERNPDEERFVRKNGSVIGTYVAAVQIFGSIEVSWPACVSTDRPFTLLQDGGWIQPDPANPGRVCTNCKVENQTFSFWGDCGNTADLWPENRNSKQPSFAK